MNVTGKVLRWLTLNTWFGLLVWFGIVERFAGPYNVLCVWIGFEFALAPLVFFGLNAVRLQEIPYTPAPEWLRVLRPWVQLAFIVVFAWFGHFVLAVCYAIACGLMSVVWQRQREAHEGAEVTTP